MVFLHVVEVDEGTEYFSLLTGSFTKMLNPVGAFIYP